MGKRFLDKEILSRDDPSGRHLPRGMTTGKYCPCFPLIIEKQGLSQLPLKFFKESWGCIKPRAKARGF